MKKLFLAALLLASCSPSNDSNQQVVSTGTPEAGKAPAAESRPSSRRLTSLVGLYEGGSGEPRNQMCVVEGEGGEQRFGLIVWGGNQHSCMGSGSVSRDGDRLRLAMAGDSACTIEATVSGTTIRLPSSVPQGCAYYCGQRASLGGAELRQQGTTEAAAKRAKDLVGEALCAGEGD